MVSHRIQNQFNFDLPRYFQDGMVCAISREDRVAMKRVSFAAFAASNAVQKWLFLDLVKVLSPTYMAATQIPAKIEGLAFGPDVAGANGKIHTLRVANDNDFVQDYAKVANSNPNQFFVFGFTASGAVIGLGTTIEPEVWSHS